VIEESKNQSNESANIVWHYLNKNSAI